MNANATVTSNFSALLNDLGGSPVARGCKVPVRGHAAIEDQAYLNSQVVRIAWSILAAQQPRTGFSPLRGHADVGDTRSWSERVLRLAVDWV